MSEMKISSGMSFSDETVHSLEFIQIAKFSAATRVLQRWQECSQPLEDMNFWNWVIGSEFSERVNGMEFRVMKLRQWESKVVTMRLSWG
jgi:hypothetical protein